MSTRSDSPVGRAASTPGHALGHYVNDRPYAASSLLSVALADVFRTARAGRCAMKPELAATPMPLEIALPALPCRGGPQLAERLFAPLGWTVEAVPVPLDDAFPEWGDSHYVRLTLHGDVRLADALNHLYVLLPVLDDAKHYWVASDEIDKLIRAGESWLAEHPERELITRRYLRHQSALFRSAFERLAELGDDVEERLEPPVEEEPDNEAVLETDTVAAAAARRASPRGSARCARRACGRTRSSTWDAVPVNSFPRCLTNPASPRSPAWTYRPER